MFWRSFGAPDFAAFWRYWNPVYGYVLAYFVYRPLRVALPRSVSTVATFAFSGFVFHDLLFWPPAIAAGRRLPFPLVTVAFCCIALFISVTTARRLSLQRLSLAARIAAHAVALLGAFALALVMRMLLT